MDLSRRAVLRACAGASAAGLVAGGATLFGRPAAARPAEALRPPGALEEPRFVGACVRCGLCVRDCPPGTLRLATWDDALSRALEIGTPYFVARDVPCEMCEAVPCVKACPTGALDHALVDIDRARMGTAVLADEENCLNFLGLRCDVCYRVCPVIDRAITLEKVSNPRSDRHAMLLPTVHADACTGCGKCEKSCVLEKPAIRVLPTRLARGASGDHYRTGWTAGEGTLPRFEQPRQNLPEQPVPGDLVPLRSGRDPYARPDAPEATR
jgi:ferredoxin-type protein NapG